MSDLDFKSLIESNTRADGYVLANRWCEAYRQKWRDFTKTYAVRQYIKALQDKGLNAVIVEGERRGARSWVHPLLAIKLAEWLNPEFELFVKDTFRRYIEGDITLADEIIQRQTDPEKIEWLGERIEGKKARMEFTSELQRRGVTGNGFARNTNAIYRGLFDSDAAELKEKLQVSNPRDGMNQLQLAATRLAELAAIERMKKNDSRGNGETVQQSERAASVVRQVLDDCNE